MTTMAYITLDTQTLACVACAQGAWVDKTLRYPRRLTLTGIQRDSNGLPCVMRDDKDRTVCGVSTWAFPTETLACADCGDALIVPVAVTAESC